VVEHLSSKHEALNSNAVPPKKKNKKKKTNLFARCQWLMPVILVTQEAEIRRISVRSQPRQIVCEILSQKEPSQK
jgi:hypothetical protein